MGTEPSNSELPYMEDGHNFFKVARTQNFVDKSLMIETALKSNHRLLITAPSKFGKSTNLHMMKVFLSDRSDRTESEVFRNLVIYKRSKKFFKQHFNKYKVVFLDFTSGKSASYSDALDAYRWAIHNTFLEHDYLLRTSKLKTSEEKIFSSWCDMNRGYKNKLDEDMVNDLSMLVDVLARQSGNKVIILVDEYDSIITKGMHEGQSEYEFNAICKLTTYVLRSLLRENTKVKLAIVCGKSNVVAYFIITMFTVDFVPFLGNHEFVQFYGLMKDELKTILKIYDSKELFVKTGALNLWYGSYNTTNNDTIFNIFSVLKSLKNGTKYPYWPIHYQVEQFLNLSRSPNIARIINQLLYEESVILEIPDIPTPYDVNRLRLAYSNSVKSMEDITILVYNLCEYGFLNMTYIKPDDCLNTSETRRYIEVNLTNFEINIIFSHYFQIYLIQYCNIPTNYYRSMYINFATNRQKSGVLKLGSIFYDAIL